MSVRGISGFLNVNGNLTRAGGEARSYQLPRLSPFPKLDRSRLPVSPPPLKPTPARTATVIGRGPAEVPEMTTDVIDPSLRYAAGNVKRSGAARRGGLGAWIGRVLGGHRAARL